MSADEGPTHRDIYERLGHIDQRMERGDALFASFSARLDEIHQQTQTNYEQNRKNAEAITETRDIVSAWKAGRAVASAINSTSKLVASLLVILAAIGAMLKLEFFGPHG